MPARADDSQSCRATRGTAQNSGREIIVNPSAIEQGFPTWKMPVAFAAPPTQMQCVGPVGGNLRQQQYQQQQKQKQHQQQQQQGTDSIPSYSKVPRIQAIKTRDIFRTLRTFAANTTAHGFYHLNHPVRYFQTGWIILIIAAFVGVTVHMSLLIVKYRDEPTSTKINPRGSNYVAPDITVCNRMMFAISKIVNKTLVFNSTTNTTSYVYGLNPEFQPVFDSVQKVREFLEVSVRRYLRLSFGNYEEDSDMLRVEDDVVFNLPNLAVRDTYGVPFLSQFSADPKQMLLSCTYSTIACDYLDFSSFALPTFPSCMTFSLQKFLDRRPNISVNSLNELRMTLFTDSSHDSRFVIDTLQKLPGDWFNMQGTGGVVVFVHQPHTYPLLGNRIDAPVNRETIVDIRYQLYTSKSTRNHRCIESSQSPQLQEYLVIVNQTYQPTTFEAQLTDCLVDVAQHILLQRCGFIDPSLPLSAKLSNEIKRGNLSTLLESSTSALMSPTELINYIYQVFKRSNVSSAAELPAILDTLLDEEICLRSARVVAKNDPGNEKCIDHCQAKIYSSSVMPNDWPVSSIEFLQPLVQRWLQSNVYYLNGSPKANQSVNEDFIHQVNWNLYDAYKELNGPRSLNAKNFLALSFRIGDLQGLGMQTDETSAYELPELFSDIGGILGLYMGISVLTLCEVAELCLHIVTMVGMLVHRSRTKQPVQSAALRMNARKFSVAMVTMQSNAGFDLDPDDDRRWSQQPRRISRI